MDFNYTTETIIPDNTGMITIGGTQGVELPAGSQTQRPSSPAAGTLRFTTASNTLEYWNGTTWYSLVNSSSSVLSFSGGSTGLTPSIATTGAVTLSGTLNVASGGTGLTTTPTSGQLLIGNGSGYTLANLTGGTGITVTNGAGSISLSLTSGSYVSSIAGTANQISASSSTGAVTLSFPTTVNVTNLTASGQVLLASASVNAAGTNQGTATVLTAQNNLVSGGTGGVLLPTPSGAGLYVTIENRSGSLIYLYPNSGGQIENFGTNAGTVLGSGANITLVSTSTTQYNVVSAAVTAGTNLVSSFTVGVETLSLSTTPSVTSLTASSLTPNSFIYPTTGGLITSTAAATNGQLLIGSTGSAPVAANLTAGVGVSVTNAGGSITIANSNATTGFVTIGASATSQGTATALPYAYNIVNATNGGSAVILPTPTAAGQFINVENRSGAGVMIYPNIGGQIENLGTNAGLSTNVGQGGYNFIAGSTTQWYFTQTLYTNGPGMSLVAATSGVNGVLQFNNSGVLSISTSGAGISASASTGNITLSNPNDTVTTVTAAGTNQGTAATLSLGYNNVSTVAAGTGVICPSNPTVGATVTIDNNGSNTLTVYPASGASVDGGATNASFTIPAGGNTPVTLIAISTTQWNTVDPETLAGSGITITNGPGSITISSAGVLSDTGTANQILVNGATTAQTGANVFTIAPNVILPGNSSETIPNGTTAQRPATPTVAMMRYNTTEDILEGYAQYGTGYTNVGTSVDQDNFVFQKTMNYRKRRAFYDEFMFGSAPSTVGNIKAFGDLGWSNYGSATGINSIITGVTDHPGILSLGTAATASANMALYSNLPSATSGATNGTIPLAQIEHAIFIVRIPSLTNLQTLNIGFVDNGALSFTNAYVNGVFFQYFYQIGYWLPVTYNAGTETYAPTTQITVAANTWYMLELWNLGTSLVWSVNGTVIKIQTTGIPTTSILQPAVQIINNTAATSVTVQIDAFSMITQELGNRY